MLFKGPKSDFVFEDQKGIWTEYCVKKQRALLMPIVWYPGPNRVKLKMFEHVLDVKT